MSAVIQECAKVREHQAAVGQGAASFSRMPLGPNLGLAPTPLGAGGVEPSETVTHQGGALRVGARAGGSAPPPPLPTTWAEALTEAEAIDASTASTAVRPSASILSSLRSILVHFERICYALRQYTLDAQQVYFRCTASIL